VSNRNTDSVISVATCYKSIPDQAANEKRKVIIQHNWERRHDLIAVYPFRLAQSLKLTTMLTELEHHLIAGLQIAAPGAAVLLITDIAFAFLNRAVPQMQVYYVGMPVKIIVGLIIVAAALPLLTYAVSGLVQGSPNDVLSLLKGMRK